VAVLETFNPARNRQLEEAEAAAKALGLVTIPISAPSRDDLGHAFEKMVQESVMLFSFFLIQ
jgi:hypothetical protein